MGRLTDDHEVENIACSFFDYLSFSQSVDKLQVVEHLRIGINKGSGLQS